MRTVHIEKLGIEKDDKKTKEFKAVFRYRDLESICKHLMIEVLEERGEISREAAPAGFDPDKEIPQVRVESRLCEPDGEMGYPGIAITLMYGDAGYYPKLMERKHGLTEPTRIGHLTLRSRPTLWERLKGLFS